MLHGSIFPHVADADHFSAEASEGAVQKDVMLLQHPVEYLPGGSLFRNEEHGYGACKAICALAGADIATVPYAVIEQMTKHPLTDQGIAKFQADYKAVFGE